MMQVDTRSDTMNWREYHNKGCNKGNFILANEGIKSVVAGNNISDLSLITRRYLFNLAKLALYAAQIWRVDHR